MNKNKNTMRGFALFVVFPLLADAFSPLPMSVQVRAAAGRVVSDDTGLAGNGRATNRVVVLKDREGDAIDVTSREQFESLLLQTTSSSSTLSPLPQITVEEAEHTCGMPWRASIADSPKESGSVATTESAKDQEDSNTDDDSASSRLLYMPFWEWQMDFMKESLTNLRAQPCASNDVDFTYNANEEKKARIDNSCFASDEYRKIRMTYYDAGDNTQVFNSVWYPNPKYNLPVLGIDLLSFNRKKFLAIVDFQPLHDREEDHAERYEKVLKPIKEQYDSLKGRMSSKFYDETQFFSQQMLFARFEDESVVTDELFPAFQAYAEAHLQMVQQATPDANAMPAVLDRQRAYDTYSAERDPATGLFASMFGKEWADGYVYDFLFSLSER